MANAKKIQKKQAHQAKEETQAKRVVAGIAVGLIVVMLILVGGYYIAFN